MNIIRVIYFVDILYQSYYLWSYINCYKYFAQTAKLQKYCCHVALNSSSWQENTECAGRAKCIRISTALIYPSFITRLIIRLSKMQLFAAAVMRNFGAPRNYRGTVRKTMVERQLNKPKLLVN